jgi:WD40 repeat protein
MFIAILMIVSVSIAQPGGIIQTSPSTLTSGDHSLSDVTYAADMPPEADVGPVAPPAPPIDSMWDRLDIIDLEILSPYCIGVEFVNGEWYVSHGGESPGSNTDNIIAVIDLVTHDTVRTFLQPQVYSGWGFHDLAYDGEYLYGAGGPNIFQFDLYGNVIGTFPGPAQLNAVRALAYDPGEDVFYSSGAWNEDIYKFDRDGNVLGQWSHSLWAILGLAWDTYSPDGPWLWVHASTWTGANGAIHQWDPVTHSMTGVSHTHPSLPGYSTLNGGGLCITDEWAPGLSVFGALSQSQPEDVILVLEHMEIVTYDWEITMMLTSGDPVPPDGGPIGYDVELVSNESEISAGDCWIDLVTPTGDLYTMLNRSLELSPFANIQRSLTLNIPASAPSGTYTMYGRCGYYPGTVWNETSFTFQKQAGGDGIFDPAQFTVSGWDSGEYLADYNNFPTTANLMSVYPNPFNPTTTVSFALPQAERISLKVYNTAGASVATLVDGYRNAGVHEVTFDASSLPSGVYFARLTAGELQSTQKLLLIK